MNAIDIWNVQHGRGTGCFGEKLFSLMCKADHENRLKFQKGFPEEFALFLKWYDGEKEFFEEQGLSGR